MNLTFTKEEWCVICDELEATSFRKLFDEDEHSKYVVRTCTKIVELIDEELKNETEEE